MANDKQFFLAKNEKAAKHLLLRGFFACVRQNLVFRAIFESVSDDKFFFNVSSSFLNYIFCFRDFRIRIQNHVLNDEFLYCGY